MKAFRSFPLPSFVAAVLLLQVFAMPLAAVEAPANKLRVLVVTGGHGFERGPFLQMFRDNPEITFREVAHTNAHAQFAPEAAGTYDVVVLYDMWQPISEEARTNFLNLLKSGKGLVALHHCLAGYQDWDEYRRIIGGRYYLNDATVEGKPMKASTYLHDRDFRVRVADTNHPVTQGVLDFQIHDETYGGFEVLPDSHPLLTTDDPTSTPVIGWWRNHGPARIVYIQLGHDHFAFQNPNYRKLLANAIRWTAQHPGQN